MQPISWAHPAAVAAGAAVGALLRWRLSVWLNPVWPGLPVGTLLVNCVGGVLIGAALMWFSRVPDEFWRLLLVTGFLGGLTTFSAFSAESLQLLQHQRWAAAVLHTVAHVAGALGGAALGFRLMRLVVG
ncbi:fluoride efflux transporter CrcB [Caldimonas brevitalea]|uniref:Fluoride-specific ion channel FluC n=1 Tax=Caldimonas brevitalea TaxID=413882 RepID=A0A0G3BI63_9BURK|nr:fluoride efflux transporter CrcB [Caldimonas brevitalea]AKJ29057.1 camphor resistance protein CrcB [Caldimonas brevitalea]